MGRVALVSAGALAMLAGPALAATPTINTGQVLQVTSTGAQINLTVNPQGTDTFYQVLYGPTGGPLSSMTSFQDAGAGTAPIVENIGIDQLTPGTAYTFQASAFQNDTGMATTDPTTGTFTTTAAPTGPGTPIIPPQNPPTNGIFGFCSTDVACLSDLNGDNALLEGLAPISLPSNWATLTGPEQIFVYDNLARIVRGETPIPNLVNTYDAIVQTGVATDADPAVVAGQESIWAGAFPTVLGAMYGWLDNDGPGGSNLDCTTTTARGCFGHRDALIDDPGGTIGNPTEIDAQVGPDNAGNTGYAALFANNPNPTPAANIVMSWASELQFLAPPALGGVLAHGPVPTDSHLAFKPATFIALAGAKKPAIVLDTLLDANRGTVISYSDSRVATTTFTVEQVLAGVTSHRKCVAATRTIPKGAGPCVRYVKLGSFIHTDTKGTNRFRFTGRLDGVALKPGSYLISASPRTATGRGGAAVKLAFKIVR